MNILYPYMVYDMSMRDGIGVYAIKQYTLVGYQDTMFYLCLFYKVFWLRLCYTPYGYTRIYFIPIESMENNCICWRFYIWLLSFLCYASIGYGGIWYMGGMECYISYDTITEPKNWHDKKHHFLSYW